MRRSSAAVRRSVAPWLVFIGRTADLVPGHPTRQRPSSITTWPSAVSRPPLRVSMIRSQPSADSFVPPVSG